MPFPSKGFDHLVRTFGRERNKEPSRGLGVIEQINEKRRHRLAHVDFAGEELAV